MLENSQPIKIANRSYWLNAFLRKSKSILTENDNKINIIDADIKDADISNLLFVFPFVNRHPRNHIKFVPIRLRSGINFIYLLNI